MAVALAAMSQTAHAINLPGWCNPKITKAFIDSLKDYSFVDKADEIAEMKALWIERIKADPDGSNIDPARLGNLAKISLFEAYLEQLGIKPFANKPLADIEQIRTQGTLAQKARLATILDELKTPVDGKRLQKAMVQLYRLQLEFDPRFLPLWAKKIRKWFIELPDEVILKRLQSQLIEDEGQFLVDHGAAKSRPPSSRKAAAKKALGFVLSNYLLYHYTGLTPLDAPILPRMHFFAFVRLVLPISKKTAKSVAYVDSTFNFAARTYMLIMAWQAVGLLTSKEARFFFALASDLLTKTPEQWRSEELESFMQGDKVREMRAKFIEDAIRGYKISQQKDPPQEYIDNQHKLWGTLEVEDLGVFLTPEDVEVYKKWFVHRTDFRWNKTIEHFKLKSEITDLRDDFVAARVAEMEREAQAEGVEFEKTPYVMARLRDDFDYWDLSEASKTLKLKDQKILEMWRALQKKIHIEEKK